jgi:hypothetical protein
MGELVEPVAAETTTRARVASGGGEAGVGDLRPRRARIMPVDP